MGTPQIYMVPCPVPQSSPNFFSYCICHLWHLLHADEMDYKMSVGTMSSLDDLPPFLSQPLIYPSEDLPPQPMAAGPLQL